MIRYDAIEEFNLD